MAKDKKDSKEKKIKSSGKGERFADMSATAVVVEEPILDETAKTEEIKVEGKTKTQKVRGKKYQKNKKLVKTGQTYSIKEALELLKKISYAKFGGTVELHLNVIEKGLSGNVTLPHFEGKARKIAIFDDKIAEEIKSGKINFEVLLATPADMPKILTFAKILGPKGLMPNPKNNTLSSDPQKAMEKLSGGGLYFKTDKDFPILHIAIGKLSQPDQELIANFEALIKAVNPKKITKAIIKSTMSPAIKVAL